MRFKLERPLKKKVGAMVFEKLKNLKLNIDRKINEQIEEKAMLTEKIVKNNEAKDFLENLKSLSGFIHPYKNPRTFDLFREYPHIDEICFKTREDRYSLNELINSTGLTSLRYVGGWDCDKWEASYKEYVNIFQSSSSNVAKNIQSALRTIHVKIKDNQSEYENFIIKYSETLSNIIEIINQFGIRFILEDGEIFSKIKDLITSFVQEYDNYTNAVRDYKKAQILEKLDLEQKFVDKMISDSSFLLEYSQK